MSWSAQQERALKQVRDWFTDPHGPQIFRLFGFAGTGKTTLAREIETIVRGHGGDRRNDVLYGAFTGKAALVMRQKGCRRASTIHSMIYRLDDETAGVPKFVLNEESDVRDAKLVIIDECSMVGAELAADLLSFGARVLVLGDPAQLPPVQDAGFFTNVKPDVMLTEVHRQARDNPIIRMSMALTVHKSQGSQWDDVVLIDESSVFREDRVRHLYTGITRAAKTLTVVM